MGDAARVLSESSVDTAKIRSMLERGVREGVYPGCALMVAKRGAPVVIDSAGTMGLEQQGPAGLPATEHTVYDVAQLTQILVTTTIYMALVDEGRVDLNHRVARYIPGFNTLGKAPVTIGHLLSHTSGLASSMPFFEELANEHASGRLGIMTSRSARDYVITSITRSQLKFEPGTRQQYSELDFILLGSIVELLTGLSLDKAAFRYVFQPFGLRSSSYIDLSMIRRRGIHPVRDLIAPTEECTWREKVLWGEVSDDNAWSMGGIAGHAGLFSSCSDVLRFGIGMLECLNGGSEGLSSRVVRQFFEGGVFGFPTSYKFGWDSPSKENGLEEVGFSERAVGMNGFTGCSLWLEPESSTAIAFMSNRTHPTRTNRKLHAFRAELHKTILSSI